VVDALKEVGEPGEAIVSHAALTAKVVVVCGDELVEGHATLRVVFQQVHQLQGKLLCTLHFLWSLICNRIAIQKLLTQLHV
jgi:hypothetical protein